jgi:hypothetical protein
MAAARMACSTVPQSSCFPSGSGSASSVRAAAVGNSSTLVIARLTACKVLLRKKMITRLRKNQLTGVVTYRIMSVKVDRWWLLGAGLAHETIEGTGLGITSGG